MGKYVGAKRRGGGVGSGDRKIEDADLKKRFPALFEWITVAAWEDGSARVPATLTIFAEDGLFKLCLNDREGGCTGWSAAETLQGALEGMEAGLVSGKLDWRRSKDRKWWKETRAK